MNHLDLNKNFNYPNLLESHGRFSYYYERFSDYGRVPSYRTGTPPIYQSIGRLNINCCLENNINLFYILIAIILGILLVRYCIFRLSKTNSQTYFYFIDSYFTKRDRR